jgi:hypothetical protein
MNNPEFTGVIIIVQCFLPFLVTNDVNIDVYEQGVTKSFIDLLILLSFIYINRFFHYMHQLIDRKLIIKTIFSFFLFIETQLTIPKSHHLFLDNVL